MFSDKTYIEEQFPQKNTSMQNQWKKVWAARGPIHNGSRGRRWQILQWPRPSIWLEPRPTSFTIPRLLQGTQRTSIHGWSSTPQLEEELSWWQWWSYNMRKWGYCVRALKIINKQQGSLESFELLARVSSSHRLIATRKLQQGGWILNVMCRAKCFI